MTDIPPLISADCGILVGRNDLVRQVAAVAGEESTYSAGRALTGLHRRGGEGRLAGRGAEHVAAVAASVRLGWASSQLIGGRTVQLLGCVAPPRTNLHFLAAANAALFDVP